MATYTNFGKNRYALRSHNPLTDEQIKFIAPSVFTTGAHESRSDRYVHIPTYVFLEGLRKNGFFPVMAGQSKTRDTGNREYTKHVLRFRHESSLSTHVGAEVKEIGFSNSHMGVSPVLFFAGVYVLICGNGLVCGDEIADFSVRHTGDAYTDVIEGAYTVLGRFDAIDESMTSMKGTKLTQVHKHAFAEAALTYRFGDRENSPIGEEDILKPRRAEDDKDDVWTTLNVIQENLVNGGIHGRNHKHKLIKTRPVHAVDSNIKLNKALWVMAERMTAYLN